MSCTVSSLITAWIFFYVGLVDSWNTYNMSLPLDIACIIKDAIRDINAAAEVEHA